jgi:hypothetical protein
MQRYINVYEYLLHVYAPRIAKALQKMSIIPQTYIIDWYGYFSMITDTSWQAFVLFCLQDSYLVQQSITFGSRKSHLGCLHFGRRGIHISSGYWYDVFSNHSQVLTLLLAALLKYFGPVLMKGDFDESLQLLTKLPKVCPCWLLCIVYDASKI